MANTHNTSSQDNSQLLRASPEVNGEESTHDVQLSEDEAALLIRMYNLLGPRWDLIAGRIPGRSAEEIKHYWFSKYSTTSSTSTTTRP